MYFNYLDFLKALRLSFLQKPFRIRRWLYILFFTALFLSSILLVALLRWLDTLFYPDFRKIEESISRYSLSPLPGAERLFSKICSARMRNALSIGRCTRPSSPPSVFKSWSIPWFGLTTSWAASLFSRFSNGRAMLIKSTQSCGTIESLKKEFPDARFITIMRHPFDAIASNLSLTVPVWQAHSPEITKDGPESQAYAELQVEWYKYLFRFRSQVSLENNFCIDYRDLRDDPVRTIEGVYDHFGWVMSEIFQAKLGNIGARNKNYQSNHHYTLEEFGLSRQTLARELAAILETYGLV